MTLRCPAQTEQTDLAELVRPAVSRVTAAAQRADIRLTTALTPAPVIGARVLLEQLIENLADNGVRHNRPGGWLTIRTARHASTVELTAQSSGPCITPHEAASLFEPFRQLRADRVASANGSGLGLSIVRAIARAHGGDATATPVDGGGLRVTVLLPVAPPASSPQARRETLDPPAASGHDLTKLSPILVVPPPE